MVETWAKVTIPNVCDGYEVSNKGNVRRSHSNQIKVWNDIMTDHGRDDCVVLDTSDGYTTFPISYVVACSFVDGFLNNIIEHLDKPEHEVDQVQYSSVEKKGSSSVAVPKRCIDLNTGIEYDSMKQVQSLTGLSRSSVSRMVHGQKDEVDGYKIRFI